MLISSVVELLGLRDRPQGDFVTLAGFALHHFAIYRNRPSSSLGTAGVSGSSTWKVRGSTRCLSAPLKRQSKTFLSMAKGLSKGGRYAEENGS